MSDTYDWSFNHDPTLSFGSPLLSSLFGYWTEKRAGRAMPARADLDPTDPALKAHLGFIVLIDVEHAPLRFRFRLIGSQVTSLVGRDSTGRYLDELYAPEALGEATESYRWIVAHRAPLRTLADLRQANREWLKIEALDLPLSRDQTDVDMILTRIVLSGS